jgi:hypothetical protein
MDSVPIPSRAKPSWPVLLAMLFLFTTTIISMVVDAVRQSQVQQTRPDEDSKPQQQPSIRHRRLQKLLQTNSRSLDCSRYQYSIGVTDDLTLNYVVNVDENLPARGTFSVEIVYQGRGWLGLAQSASGSMVGSVAIIGLPESQLVEEQKVQKYVLNGQNIGSIQWLPLQHQTLTNTTIFQDEDRTIMRFTKPLVEDGEEFHINHDGQNIFIFAVGASNTLGLHEYRGIVALDLLPCSTKPLISEKEQLRADERTDEEESDRYDVGSYVIDIGGFESSNNNNVVTSEGAETLIIDVGDDDVETIRPLREAEPTDSPTTMQDNSEGGSSSSKGRLFWTLHGLFGTLTCGLFLPVTVTSPLLQDFCKSSKGKKSKNPIWVYFYQIFNLLSALGVTITFIMAAVAAKQKIKPSQATDAPFTPILGTLAPTASPTEDPTDPISDAHSYHSPMGLALFIILVMYTVVGQLHYWLVQKRFIYKNKPGSVDFNTDEETERSNATPVPFLERAWVQSQNLVGALLLFVSWWHCLMGMQLYVGRFEDSWFDEGVFWGVTGTMAGILGFLCFLQMVCSRLALEFDESRR